MADEATRRRVEPEMNGVAVPPSTVPEGWNELSADDGFIAMVGPFWRHRDDATRFGFLAEPRHNNINGVVQGGMLMTFADRGLGYLAFETAGGPCATVSFDMNFVSGGRIGSFIELSAEIVRQSRSLVFCRGTLLSGHDTVAVCQGTWKILGR